MKCIKNSLVLLLTCCACSVSYAQVAVKATDTTRHATDTVKKAVVRPKPMIKPKGPKPTVNEVSMGVRLNTNGWSAFTDIGRDKAKNAKDRDMFYNVHFLQVELKENKDPKETKSTAVDAFGNQTKYIYGKINNFYALKLGYGIRTIIAGKPEPGTVSIHWVNVLGGSLGLLKPYYLKVYSDPSAIKYSDQTQSDFLDQQVIEGKGKFSQGLDQLKFVPGGHYKSAIHFDFSANRKNVLGAEIGFNVEYYSTAVQLIAGQKPSSLFADLFISFQYGRRW